MSALILVDGLGRERLTELLEVPGLSTRIRARDVSAHTAARLGLSSGLAGATILILLLLVMRSDVMVPPDPLTFASIARLLGLCLLCGGLTALWVWGEATLARHAGGIGVVRFMATYFIGGALVGLIFSELAPTTGFETQGPTGLTVASVAIAATWGAVVLGVVHDGRRRLQQARSLLVSEAAGLVLTGASQRASVEGLRRALHEELEASLKPSFDDAMVHLTVEAGLMNDHITSDTARLLEHLTETSIRPLSHRLQRRAISGGVSSGPLAFIRGVMRHQPFRPGLVAGVFLLTSVPVTWVNVGTAAAIVSAAAGAALIYLILGLGNVVMACFPRWHSVAFVGFFLLLQVPWMLTEALVGPVISPGLLASWLATVAVSAAIVWLTSGIGEWRSQQGSLLRIYADDIDAARVALAAQEEVVRTLTRESARTLHGALQSRLAACILALDRAVADNDVQAYAAAMGQARAVLAEPWPSTAEAEPRLSVAAAVNAKVSLWQGLALITCEIADDVSNSSGHMAQVAGDIVEEALCNAVRHGGADTISVCVDFTIAYEAPCLRIRVTDSGCGLSGHRQGLGTAYLNQACGDRWGRSSPATGGCHLEAYVSTTPT